MGSVIGSRPNPSQSLPTTLKHTAKKPVANKITPNSKPREVDMVRGLNYYADFSGCGFWRMIWPS